MFGEVSNGDAVRFGGERFSFSGSSWVKCRVANTSRGVRTSVTPSEQHPSTGRTLPGEFSKTTP